MKAKKSKSSSKSSVAEIIAKSCGLKSLDYDPTLSDLFSSNKYQIKTAKDPIYNGFDPLQSTIVPDEDTKGNGLTLSHKDAASIRVKAKEKSRLSEFSKISKDEKLSSLPEKKRKAHTLKAKSKGGKNIKRESELEEPREETADLSPTDEFVAEELDNQDSPEPEQIKLENDPEENEVDAKDKVIPSIAELNAPKNKNPEAEARTVFVGNVPKNFTTKRLKKLFKDHGEIEAVRFRGAAPSKPTQLKKVAIFRNEIHPDRNSLVAFIRYKTREEAEGAVQSMNGVKVDEHHLTVDLADNKAKDETKAIFIGNLYLKMNDDDLWNYFEDCGKIHSVRIVRDPISGMGKGIGFVNFEDSSGVDLALKKNGTELKGRAIRISRAMTNKKKQKTISSEADQSNSNVKKHNKPSARSNTWKIRTEDKHNSKKTNFTGDRIAEIGKLKRKSSKPNRGDVKKHRIAKQLTGNSAPKKPKIKKSRK